MAKTQEAEEQVEDIIEVKRGSLKDLFMVGKLETISDGETEVTVYIQKMNNAQLDEAYKEANKAKAPIRALLRKSNDDPDKLGYIDQVDEVLTNRDDTINYIIADDLSEARMSAESELAFSDEWSKDNYLEGLQDAWADGLRDEFLEDSDNEEAKRVFAELKRFSGLVDEEIKEKRNELVYEIQDLSDEALRDKAIDKYISDIAQQEFYKVFIDYQIYSSVRDPENRSEKMFNSFKDVKELTPEAYKILQDKVTAVSMPSSEGKE